MCVCAGPAVVLSVLVFSVSLSVLCPASVPCVTLRPWHSSPTAFSPPCARTLQRVPRGLIAGGTLRTPRRNSRRVYFLRTSVMLEFWESAFSLSDCLLSFV